MGHKLVTQVILIATALVIIFAFIKPSFSTISETQDELFRYKDTVSKAVQFNTILTELVNREKSFSPDKMRALEVFMPSKIDTAVVMRDINNVFLNNGIAVSSLSATEKTNPVRDVSFEGGDVSDSPDLSYQDFEIVFGAPYEDLKNILSSLEANAYLLEIVALDFGKVQNTDEVFTNDVNTEGQIPQYTMTLRAYALTGAN